MSEVTVEGMIYYGFDLYGEGVVYENPEVSRLLEAMIDNDELDDMTKAEGCEVAVEIRGGEAFPTWVICIESSLMMAKDFGTRKFNPQNLTVSYDDWDAKLKAFCEANGLPYEAPSWVLASYIG